MSLRSKTGNSLVKGMIIFALCAFSSLGILIVSDKTVNDFFSAGLGFIEKIKNPKIVNMKEIRVNSIKHIVNMDENAWPVETNLIMFKEINKSVKVVRPAKVQQSKIKAVNIPVLSYKNTNTTVLDQPELKTQISKDDIARINEHEKNIKSALESKKAVNVPQNEPIKDRVIRPIVVTHIIVSKDRNMQLYGADINTEHTALVKNRYAMQGALKKEVTTIPNTKYFKREVVAVRDN